MKGVACVHYCRRSPRVGGAEQQASVKGGATDEPELSLNGNHGSSYIIWCGKSSASILIHYQPHWTD